MPTEAENDPKITPPETDNPLPGYPPYPQSEDIYIHDKKIQDDVNIDDQSKINEPAEVNDEWDDVLDDNVLAIDDLDVPGSELDDDNEEIGEEDEENNYYSLGGDNHDE